MKFPTFADPYKNITIMWQRIQTLYLGIATGLVASLFFCNIASIIGPGGEEIGIRYYEKTSFLVLMIMMLTAHICALFSYKSWALQARVCMLTCLLTAGFQIWLGLDFIRFRHDMIFNITGVFPLACAILDFLAARAAMVDQLTLTAIGSTRKARKKRKKNQ